MKDEPKKQNWRKYIPGILWFNLGLIISYMLGTKVIAVFIIELLGLLALLYFEHKKNEQQEQPKPQSIPDKIEPAK